MRTIYLDNEFICHADNAAGRRAVQTDMLDWLGEVALESTRYVPEGETYTDAKGDIIHGEFAQVLRNIDREQAQYVNDSEIIDLITDGIDNGEDRTAKVRARLIRAHIEQASAWTDDADALEMVELFPQWKPDKAVIVGERLQYAGLLYKCVQAHTTAEEWTPDITPALWVRVSVDEWPEWIQPQGAADAYMAGDKVIHNESRWISDIDNNVWEPGVYGWTRKE